MLVLAVHEDQETSDTLTHTHKPMSLINNSHSATVQFCFTLRSCEFCFGDAFWKNSIRDLEMQSSQDLSH